MKNPAAETAGCNIYKFMIFMDPVGIGFSKQYALKRRDSVFDSKPYKTGEVSDI